MRREPLTQERLKELIKYDPETGVFTWIAGKKMAGKIAGTVSKGYVRISINRKKHKAHRLAWLYVYGVMPSAQIDHANCVKNDNRIVNVRECSIAENNFNKGPRCDSASGIKGVFWNKQRGCWTAQITIDGRSAYLGYFATAELASAAYQAKARELHGEFYRGVA